MVDGPDDLIYVSEAVRHFGAHAIDAGLEDGTLTIRRRPHDEVGWWFRRGDLGRLRSREQRA